MHCYKIVKKSNVAKEYKKNKKIEHNLPKIH